MRVVYCYAARAASMPNQAAARNGLMICTPADVYSGRGQTILMKREAIKQRTFEQRRLQHAKRAA